MNQAPRKGKGAGKGAEQWWSSKGWGDSGKAPVRETKTYAKFKHVEKHAG